MSRKKDKTLILPDIRSIGISIWDPVWAAKEHVSTLYEIVHVIDGSVVLHIGKVHYKGTNGDTLIIPVQTRHRDEFALDCRFKVLHIQFGLSSKKKKLKAGINRKLLKINQSEKEELKAAIMHLYGVFRKNRSRAQKRTALLLQDVLFAIDEFAEKKGREVLPCKHKKKSELIQTAQAYIHDHLNEHISLGDIAGHLNLSEYYLSHLFSEETGFSLSAYLTGVRMQRAADVLRDPTVRVAEAAYAAGYENPNYFGKVFRKYYGCSPGVYRSGKWAAKRKK